MDPKRDEKEATAVKPEVTSVEKIIGEQAGRDRKESMEENLERLAALNLSNDQSLQPRFSTSIIRLVSALAGIGTLILIYFIVKLFV
ncbi:MAG: hypothetical protein KJO28_01330 [Desulfofustis sp.]|nr:hypothetical protein [Desulfofustis sp.]NNF47288.1 hypothetical protein [Desulfofustis sp.]NNK55912.1 hypothetical protein [Desulfofustis sp.]